MASFQVEKVHLAVQALTEEPEHPVAVHFLSETASPCCQLKSQREYDAHLLYHHTDGYESCLPHKVSHLCEHIVQLLVPVLSTIQYCAIQYVQEPVSRLLTYIHAQT